MYMQKKMPIQSSFIHLLSSQIGYMILIANVQARLHDTDSQDTGILCIGLFKKKKNHSA